MSIDPLVTILCCPICHGSLQFNKEGYVCEECSHQFDVKQGIPILLEENTEELEYDIPYMRVGKEVGGRVGKIKDFVRRHRLLKDIVDLFHESALGRDTRKRVKVALVKGSFLLDVGCGNGTPSFRELSSSIVGVDRDLPRLKVAQDLNGYRAYLASAEKMPFRQDIFDGALCIEVIEHIANDVQMVAEVAHVLKPGGIAIITTPNGDAFPLVLPHDGGHLRHYGRKDLMALLAPFFSEVRIVSRSKFYKVGQLVYKLTYDSQAKKLRERDVRILVAYLLNMIHNVFLLPLEGHNYMQDSGVYNLVAYCVK